MRKKYLAMVLIGSILLSLAGCVSDKSGAAGASEELELLEPMNTEANYEEAMRRTLYGAKVYAGTVMPYVEEYCPETGFYFGGYGAYPGEQVRKGQELILSDTTEADKKIKEKKEAIESMEKEYNKFMEKQKKMMEEYRWTEARLEREVSKNESDEPEKYLAVQEGEDAGKQVDNPKYAEWERQYNFNVGEYRIAKHKADTIQLQMDQRTALYEMDKKHEEYLLKTLQKDRNKAIITSGMNGEVVAVAPDEEGVYLDADKPVVAVGDLTRKVIQCEYINRAVIKKAVDVFALIDGKRYEVEYQAVSSEEYARLTANGETVYTTFEIQNIDEDVLVGDYAVIAVLSDIREDVVSVPKGAVRKDDTGSYVYLIQDGQSVYTNVQTGFNDGNYVEILQGVEEGDKVLYSGGQQPGTSVEKVIRGEFHTDFSKTGRMFYPSSKLLENPVKNGTVYFGEYKVTQFQHVNKGDVIATIRVEEDSLLRKRNETKLARLKQRMADFVKENESDKDEEYYIDTVDKYQEQIEEVEKNLAEQRADTETKTIKAERSGIVVWLVDFKKEAIVVKEAAIALIGDENGAMIRVEDKDDLLQYGNEVAVTYLSADEQKKTVNAVVASISNRGLSSAMKSEWKYIRLPAEMVGDMVQTAVYGEWWNPDRYEVSAKLRTMENVLVVPKAAVYDVAGKTYVYVKDEKGRVKAQGFVAGGHNDQYYWVVQGLTEGMEVCLK